jgi:Flp pilus assembly protein TadD
MRFPLSLALTISVTAAVAADPAWPLLDRAYNALRNREYDTAITAFQEAARIEPSRASIRKDLAYTLLKVGENERARDEFAEAMRLDAADDHVALEYAFLAYETKRQADARRIFDRLRRKGNATAEQAFQNIDRPLAEAIVRWQRAVELAPDRHSTHEELARLAEQRDELDLAARHYLRAWQLRPGHRAFLLDLGRVQRAAGRPELAQAALLAASRGEESYVAEAARELLGERYPYIYEFREALALDPDNLPLRRELAWLLLEMGQKSEAEREFATVVEARPEDAWSLAQLGFLLLARNQVGEAMPMLERALQSADDELTDRVREALKLPKTLKHRGDAPRAQASADALELAQRSLDAGYLKDAIKYLRIAHENDPLNFSVMLKLGWAHNILRDDRQAVEWFRLAKSSPDPQVEAEATRAFRNLSPQFARFRTTAWALPFYSSRWREAFTYAQIRTELMPSWPVRPYLSMRFAGDTSRASGVNPSYLSENSLIFAAGAATDPWFGVRGWAEAGASVRYVRGPEGRLAPDIRGGLSWSRTAGTNFGAEKRGLFLENTADFVYVSRFSHDTILYSQNRGGYLLIPSSPAQLQLTWNLNLTRDVRGYQWANALETGPGIRLRLTALPNPLVLSLDALQGRYTVLDGTRPPRYTDFRLGLWYALTR